MIKQWFSSKGHILLWRIVNRKKRTANNRRGRMVIVRTGSSRWSRSGQLVQDWYSLDRWSLVYDWYLLVQESGPWFRTGNCWCLLVQESGRWYLLVQEDGRWSRTGSR